MMSNRGARGGPGDPASTLAMADNPAAHYACLSPGQHSLSPGNPFDPAAGRSAASVSSLNRPPFLGGSESSRFVASPRLNHSGSPLVMDAARRGEGAGLRGLVGPGYGVGQHHSSLYMPAYHIGKAADGYFGLTPHDAAERSCYVGSALESCHFDRSRCGAAPQNSYNRACESRSHFSCAVENVVGGAPERNPFFPSQHGSAHHGPPSHLYAGITDSYGHRGDHATAAADRSLMDPAAERVQNHFSSSVPSYIPLGAGSGYVYCDPSSVATLSSITPPFPGERFEFFRVLVGSPDRLRSVHCSTPSTHPFP